MQYAIAFAAVVALAQAATSIPAPPGYAPPAYAPPAGYGSESTPATTADVETSAPSTTAAVDTPAPVTSIDYVTDEITVISCGSEITNCPGNTPATSADVATPTDVPVYTTTEVDTPVETTPVATSEEVDTPTDTPTSAPADTPTSAPVDTPTSEVAPPVLVSTEAYTTCVPTTVYVTMTYTQTTPVATSLAPYATGDSGYSGYASGTGVPVQPSSTAPFVSSNDARGLSASFGGLALAAAAAVLFA